ncbi:MAG: hypothetical protein ACQETD_01970 [Pseudomonadota bacterium]
MEISRNLINPQSPGTQDRAAAERAAEARRYAEATQSAAQNRTVELLRRNEGTPRSDRVESKDNVDYGEMLQQARRGMAEGGYRPVSPAAREPLAVQRALDAYQGNAREGAYADVELLPRVDRYV